MHVDFKVLKVLMPTSVKSVPVLNAIHDVRDACVHAMEQSLQKTLQRLRGGYGRQVNSLLAQKNEKAKSKDVNMRSMTRKANKRKYNPHFYKVGLQETEGTKAKQKNAKKKKTNEQKLSSDSSFHLSDDDETIEDDTTACPSVEAIPEFELQIENIDSDNNDILQC